MEKIINTPGASEGVYLDPRGLDRVDNIELASCLATLGFGLLDCTRLKGDLIDARSPQGRVTWKFTPTSADGRYTLPQVLAAWKNDVWLSNPTNADPLAFIISAFRNRQRLMDYISKAVRWWRLNGVNAGLSCLRIALPAWRCWPSGIYLEAELYPITNKLKSTATKQKQPSTV